MKRDYEDYYLEYIQGLSEAEMVNEIAMTNTLKNLLERLESLEDTIQRNVDLGKLTR
jgi:hypothetical protein